MTGTETKVYNLIDGKFGKILESTTVRYEKIDKRREKKYQAVVGYHYGSFATAGSELMWGDFEKHIKAQFARDERISVQVSSQGAFAFNNPMVPEEVRGLRCADIAINFTIKYNKPKWIVNQGDAEEALRKLFGFTNVASIREKILAGIEVALAERSGEAAKKVRAQHANLVASNLAKRATKAAKAIANYETRLKGLHEEVEAKRREILAEIVTKLLASPEEWKFTDGTAIDKRSVEAAVKHAHEAFKPLDGDPFFSDEKNVVKEEEV